MRLFDAHAHLPQGEESFAGLQEFSAVVCAVCEADFVPLKKLAQGSRGTVVPAFGIHPWFAQNRSDAWMENLKNALAETPNAQIGEIGIDKARESECAKDVQLAVFERQLELAAQLKIPAAIHCVGWWGEMMNVLRRQHSLSKMLFHGFSGSAETAKELLALGADFSFSLRALAVPSAGMVRVLKMLPRERVFAESDEPLGQRSRDRCKSAAVALQNIFDEFMNAEKKTPQALFLDRDGTLILDKDYLHNPADVELISGTREAVHRVLDCGCKLFLLTNQSGIGRGFFTMDDYSRCHERFVELLGIRPSDFTACGVAPEHPDAPSRYRKPSPAFISEQLAEFPLLDPARCWMIGDRRSDWDCGLNAKIRSVAVATGKPIDDAARAYLAAQNIPLFANFAAFVNTVF